MATELKISQSWGIASARHTSGIVPVASTSSYVFDVPLGPSVARWNVKNGEKEYQFQAHSELIVCMLLSPDRKLIVTCSYGGEVKLWSSDGWLPLAETNTPMGSLFYLSWSSTSDRIVVVGNGYQSAAVMYTVVTDQPVSLSLLWHQQAGLYTDREKKTKSLPPPPPVTGQEYKYVDAFFAAEIDPMGQSIVVENRWKDNTVLHLYSPAGDLLRSAVLEPMEDGRPVDTVMMSQWCKGRYVIGAQGGVMIVVDSESLNVLNIIKMGYSSRTCVWDGVHLVVPSESGTLTWVNIDTGEKVWQFKTGVSDDFVRMVWSHDVLWLCGFTHLAYCVVKRNEYGTVTNVTTEYSISSHEISCCGVGLSPDSSLVAVGDLTGNVYLYSCDEGGPQWPLEMWNVGASVRCISWLDSLCVLVGCLDGKIHQWNIGQHVNVFFALEGSALHIRVSHSKKLFAVSSSQGKVGVFTVDQGKEVVCPVSVFVAHQPRPGRQDQRFGQLGHQAEVWSLCWSPDDGHMATCSEDQSVRVWNTGKWEREAVLTGHQLAVTSVDWKMVGERSILVSCSDDRTVRIYHCSDQQYQLMSVLNTKDIHGWHTLTYLTFNPVQDSSLLAVSTQHGYLVVWSVNTGRQLVKRKMHCGSVEGLVWRGTKRVEEKEEEEMVKMVSVGADCVANLWTLSNH